MEFRTNFIKFIFKNISLPQGDLWHFENQNLYKISCIFVFWKRIFLMKNVLNCLVEQNFDKNKFEIILIEDKGGSKEGKNLANEFDLNISYFAPSTNWGKMGYMRNYGLSKAKGEIILFLDDDTVILDKKFLLKLVDFFDKNTQLMAVIPKGNSLFCLRHSRYSYHDPYFFTNRCMAYRKSCLLKLNGFCNNFIGQEDVEFAIRFLAKGYKYIKTEKIQYFHPPFIVKDLKKPQAVGFSFARSSYPVPIKILLGLNGSRWLYRILYPTLKNRYMAKFAIGFLIGFLKGIFKKNSEIFYV